MKKTCYKLIDKIPVLIKPVSLAVILVVMASTVATAVILSNRNGDSASQGLTKSDQSGPTVTVTSEPAHALSLSNDDQVQHKEGATATSKSSQASSQASDNVSSGSTSNYSMPDADGCTPGLNGYKKCRASADKLNFMDKCDTDMSAVEDTYDSINSPALDSYIADVAAKQKEVNYDIEHYGYSQSWGANVMYDYMQQRTQQYHALVDPAYSTYATAVDAINDRGCNLPQLYNAPAL